MVPPVCPSFRPLILRKGIPAAAAIIAQSKLLVPADKALYKLRDETNTVKSLPLIASSVVSKKLASGAQVFVLDVKTGAGAFMDTEEGSVKLAKLMVRILQNNGKKAAAIISDMNSPLGEGVGGVLEVIDAIEVLEGKESRLSKLAILIAGKLISLAKNISLEAGKEQAASILKKGIALQKLKEIIHAQGGALDLFERSNRECILSCQEAQILSETDGFVEEIDCVTLGILARKYEEGGGYGMMVYPKVGVYYKKGDPIVKFYGKGAIQNELIDGIKKCFKFTKKERRENPLVYEIVES